MDEVMSVRPPYRDQCPSKIKKPPSADTQEGSHLQARKRALTNNLTMLAL